MPGGDRTGPMGLGPMTGRAAGFCGGYGMPGYMNPVGGRGYWGRGRGGGRGWRNWFYATGLTGWQRVGMGYPAYGVPVAPMAPAISREQELAALKNQAQYFEGALEDIKKRLEELEAELSSTRRSLGKKQEELKRSSEEIAALKNNFVNYLGELAVYYQRTGNRDKALELYLLLIQYDPGAGSAYLGLGEIYLDMGEYQKSEEMFRKAAEYFKE